MREMFTKLVGSTFYHGANEFISFLKPDDELTLIKEDENKFDDKALQVSVKGFKIGYIPGASSKGDTPTNVLIRELIDNNKFKRAVVSEVTGGGASKNYGLNIKIEYED